MDTTFEPMKNTVKTFIIVAIVLIGVVSFFAVKNYSSKNYSGFAESVGRLQASGNNKLQSNINSYMESKKSEYDLGKDNYHCSNILYGYDDKYAYAWVYCSGFMSKEGELEQGTAFSIPTRLEYQGSDFKIVDFQQPMDGDLYDPTLRKLFPKRFYDIGHPSNAEINKLDQEVRDKARIKSGD